MSSARASTLMSAPSPPLYLALQRSIPRLRSSPTCARPLQSRIRTILSVENKRGNGKRETTSNQKFECGVESGGGRKTMGQQSRWTLYDRFYALVLLGKRRGLVVLEVITLDSSLAPEEVCSVGLGRAGRFVHNWAPIWEYFQNPETPQSRRSTKASAGQLTRIAPASDDCHLVNPARVALLPPPQSRLGSLELSVATFFLPTPMRPWGRSLTPPSLRNTGTEKRSGVRVIVH